MNPALFPKSAAAFIAGNRLPGNLFHPYVWGGYLGWKLHPARKVFIDGRALIPLTVYSDVHGARGPWREILERYDVRTVLTWAVLPYRGKVPPIVFALIKDPEWHAVYWDAKSLIFIKDPAPGLHTLKQNTVWEVLESLTSTYDNNNDIITSHPKNQEPGTTKKTYYRNPSQHWPHRGFRETVPQPAH